MNPIKQTPQTVSITLEDTGATVVTRRGRGSHVYHGEAQRHRLLAFCLERGFRRSETKIGVIYRNWL